MHVGHQRINNIIESFKKGEKFSKKIGRPSVINEQIEFFIEKETLSNSMVAASEIRNKLKSCLNHSISLSTINRIRNKLLFHFRPPKIKQFLSEIHKRNRIQFCSDFLCSQDDSKRIYFSDESRFEKSADNSWRWSRKNEIIENQYILKNKFNCGIMIWGCIGYNFKSKIMIIEKTINSSQYCKLIENSDIIKTLNDTHGMFNWYLQQDGALSHTSEETMEYLLKKIKILPGWPANSPDLNPIENICAIMKKIIKKTI